ncbi:MAG TPA: SCP2 sterol-binding domain-containing protein [Acidimicrobiia bacterium]|nr:SCP2 sterol-binding domain-containing protein [Acidimicrobiia bacterium]
MAVYQQPEEVQAIFGDLFERILALPESNRLFSEAGAVLGVYYTDPECTVIIDGTKTPAELSLEDRPVDIELRMSADTGHTFWKGELNFPVAMMKGKAKVKGPSDVVMKLLPAVLPGQGLYPDVLKAHGREDLL